jgi:hypothetical protein
MILFLHSPTAADIQLGDYRRGVQYFEYGAFNDIIDLHSKFLCYRKSCGSK